MAAIDFEQRVITAGLFFCFLIALIFKQDQEALEGKQGNKTRGDVQIQKQQHTPFQNPFHTYVTVLNNRSHVWICIFFSYVQPFSSLLDPSRSHFPGFYSAKADMVIYCGHPSLILIHHRPVARQSWQQLFAFEFDRGAVSQRRQVKSITNVLVSRWIINQRRKR